MQQFHASRRHHPYVGGWYVPSSEEEQAMLKVRIDDDVLGVRPEGPITREDVATLTRAADEYLAGHP
jgi:hypothetical protein